MLLGTGAKRLRALMLAIIVAMIYGLTGFGQADSVTSGSETSATIAATLETTATEGVTTSSEHAENGDETARVQEAVHHALPKILVTIMLILLVAKIGGDLLERVGQPAVLGELAFGILLGNLAFLHLPGGETIDRIFHNHEVSVFITLLAELGVILLLFEVGLESTVREMVHVGPTAFIVAVLGILAPMGLGYMVGLWFLPNAAWTVHLFLGAVMAATSVGITARVLKDLGKMDRPESKIILGAAVIDDILGLIVLAVASGAVAAANAGGSIEVGQIGMIVFKAVGFFVVAIALGRLLSPQLYRFSTFLQTNGVLISVTLAWCFFIAWVGTLVGVAPIVGAFAAGLVLEDVTFQTWNKKTADLEDLIKPLTAFLVPIFFVHTGMNVKLSVFTNPSILGFAAVLTIAAVVGKQLCSLGVREKSLNRLAVGIGMIPRGEVGLIVANIGRGLKDSSGNPIIGADTFGATVIMVVITTMITPPALKWVLDRKPTAEVPS